MKSKYLCLFVFLSLALTPLASLAEEGIHSLGLQGGETMLTNDWGSPWGNALGAGAFFRYAASDWLEIEVGYLNSKHSSTANGYGITLNQNAFNLDAVYNIDMVDIFVPYIKGGVEYVTHTQDIPGVTSNLTSQSYNGFGLNFGVGGDFLTSKHFAAGLDMVFHDIFNVQSNSVPGTGPVIVMGNYFTVLAHVVYRFGGNGPSTSGKPGKTF